MRRIRWPFIVALAGVAVWGLFAHREYSRRETAVLATTTCPFRGEPVTSVDPSLSQIEMAHVTAHEQVHAQQCRALGPFRYRLKNLTSKLEMEAPAYCAGALVKIALGVDTADVRVRLLDDAVEALRGTADSADVVMALEALCPAVVRRRRGTAGIRA
jgi:hypothetical protein